MKQGIEKNKDIMIEALIKHLGIVTDAMKEIGMSRNTFYQYVKTDPEFKARVDDIYEVQGDFVEGHLFKRISDGDTQAIIFYMKHKGKKRGYSDSIDINIKEFKTKWPGVNDDDHTS